MKVDDILQGVEKGVETLWDKMHDGWSRLRESAAGALTRFKAGEAANLPPARDIDMPPRALGSSWALLGGDVFEDEQRVVVRLEVPGMNRQDFDITVQGDMLVVRGQKRFEAETTEGRWRVLQCAYGEFQRSVPLPVAVKHDEARAVYRDGVLKIELPKAEVAKPKAMTIVVS